MEEISPDIGVAFLARGAEPDWRLSCLRFLESYLRHRSGAKHSLYVILKGFRDDEELLDAKRLFSTVDYIPVALADDSFDIGAYIAWANQVDHDTVCFFNTSSEILAEDWLLKLARNLAAPGVGLAGASGSYESLRPAYRSFPKFPNIHIRSNAFMIRRKLFCELSNGVWITDKRAAHGFESGPDGMTRKVMKMGLEPAVVGRNGRGYSPIWWAASGTFRQQTQANLLVSDNQTRSFMALPFAEKHQLATKTWGAYLRERRLPLRGTFAFLR